MSKYFIIIVIATLLFSCGSPLDKEYNVETFEKDGKELSKNLDSTEAMIIAGTIMRYAFEGKTPEGLTYRELLEDGKNWQAEQKKIEAEQKALAERARIEEAERIKRLSEAVLVTCFEKGYYEYNYREFITYKFVIQNKSDKEIRAIKGSIIFTNLFDDEIKSLSFVYDESIEAGKEATWEASTDYSEYDKDDVTLKTKDLDDIKVVWKPEKIIFTDGSTLE